MYPSQSTTKCLTPCPLRSRSAGGSRSNWGGVGRFFFFFFIFYFFFLFSLGHRFLLYFTCPSQRERESQAGGRREDLHHILQGTAMHGGLSLRRGHIQAGTVQLHTPGSCSLQKCNPARITSMNPSLRHTVPDVLVPGRSEQEAAGYPRIRHTHYPPFHNTSYTEHGRTRQWVGPARLLHPPPRQLSAARRRCWRPPGGDMSEEPLPPRPKRMAGWLADLVHTSWRRRTTLVELTWHRWWRHMGLETKLSRDMVWVRQGRSLAGGQELKQQQETSKTPLDIRLLSLTVHGERFIEEQQVVDVLHM